MITVAALTAAPLSVPLLEPFVIATGRMDATRAALVTATLRDEQGKTAVGYGEAAALPPVTREDQPDVLVEIARAAHELRERSFAHAGELTHLLDESLSLMPVARAGAETAILDAWARLEGVPLAQLLGGGSTPVTLITDITLPIAAPEHMADLARAHRRRGFDCFKVKVGIDPASDLAALRAVHAAVPDARFRIDANGGYDAATALRLLDSLAELTIECFEQPCARDDVHGMHEVTARSRVPVVADESVQGPDDVDELVARQAAHGVNLKLAKLGGPLRAVAVARRARAAGLKLMAGAMVETRLGLVAMAHTVVAAGGVDWIDLDTAFLLDGDPFEGGWSVEGAQISLIPGAGTTIRPK